MSEVYEIVFEPRVQKDLDKIPAELYGKIDKAILGLSKNPRSFGVKKLDRDIHRIRVQDWRVLFVIFGSERRVTLLRVVRRNEKTYKDL